MTAVYREPIFRTHIDIKQSQKEYLTYLAKTNHTSISKIMQHLIETLIANNPQLNPSQVQEQTQTQTKPEPRFSNPASNPIFSEADLVY